MYFFASDAGNLTPQDGCDVWHICIVPKTVRPNGLGFKATFLDFFASTVQPWKQRAGGDAHVLKLLYRSSAFLSGKVDRRQIRPSVYLMAPDCP